MVLFYKLFNNTYQSPDFTLRKNILEYIFGILSLFAEINSIYYNDFYAIICLIVLSADITICRNMKMRDVHDLNIEV